MPASVKYVTKVVNISEVELTGKLHWEQSNDPDDYGHWAVGTDNLQEWLDKFDGKHVYLTIKAPARDESHLLPKED